MNYVTHSKIQKWGNGYGVLLPKKIVDESLFAGESPVTLTFTTHGVSLTPATKEYTLAEMVAGMKLTGKEKKHVLLDFGSDVGKEIWQ